MITAKLTVIKPMPATLAAVMEQMPGELDAISTSLKQNSQAAATLMDCFDCSREQLATEVLRWKKANFPATARAFAETSGGQRCCK